MEKNVCLCVSLASYKRFEREGEKKKKKKRPIFSIFLHRVYTERFVVLATGRVTCSTNV